MATQMAEIRKKTDESNVNLEQQLMTRDEILTYVETHPDRETLIRFGGYPFSCKLCLQFNG